MPTVKLRKMSNENIINHQTKCKQNLPFEVIAVPQYNDSQLVTNAEHYLTDPINVKIRIRNKDEVGKQGTISVPKLPSNSGRKVRLVSSDQTIMSFDLLMEPEFNKKNQKKNQKNIFNIFRSGGCFKVQNDNDDEYSYLPSSKNEENTLTNTNEVITSIAVEPNNIISEKITLKKNFPPITTNDRHFMGKCKPGGCLDPPFDEDKYSYTPISKLSNKNLPTKDEDTNDTSIKEANKSKLKTEVDNKGSMLDEKVFRKQFVPDEHIENSIHSLITYPTTPSYLDVRKHKNSRDNKKNKKISIEDKARISTNEFTEIYFMPKKDKSSSQDKTSFENINKKNLAITKNKNDNDNSISVDGLDESSLIEKAERSVIIKGSEVKLYTDENDANVNNKNVVIGTDNLKYPLKTETSIETPRNSENSGKRIHSDCIDKNIKDKIIPKEGPSDNNTSKINSKKKQQLMPEFVAEDVVKKKDTDISYKSIPNEMSSFDTEMKNVQMNDSTNRISLSMTETKVVKKSIEESQKLFSFELTEVVSLDSVKSQRENFGSSEDFVSNIVKYDEILSKDIKNNAKNITDTQSPHNIQLDDREINNSENNITQPKELIHSFHNYHEICETDMAPHSNVESITNTNYTSENLQIPTSVNAAPAHQEQNCYEKPFEPDNTSLKNFQLQTLSDDVNNFNDNKDLKSEKDSITEVNYNNSLNTNDKNSIVNSVSNDNSLKLAPITTISSRDRISRAESNATNKIQNKMDNINHKSFIKEVKESPIFESLKNNFDSKSLVEVDNKISSSNETSKITDSVIKFDRRMDKTASNNNIRILLGTSTYENIDYGNKNVSKKSEINYSIQQKDILDLSTYSSVAIDFGFGCTVDENNKLTVKTFDTSTPWDDNVQGQISIIKSIIRIDDDEIVIPITFDANLSMKIKNAKVINKGTIVVNPINVKEKSIKSSSTSSVNKDGLLKETLKGLFENLLPLNEIIRNLKEEANHLSNQQTLLKESLKTMEIQPKRLIHTYSQCGCEKN